MPSQPRPRSCHGPLTIRTGTALRHRDRIDGEDTDTSAHADERSKGSSIMATKPPTGDPVQDAPQVEPAPHAAAGLPAVAHSLRIAQQQMGVRRTAQTLLKVNQKDGFDCPGCAWPEGDKRHIAEFCENGAKAVAEEATLRRVGPEFFAEHSLADLEAHDDWWLGQQGRL